MRRCLTQLHKGGSFISNLKSAKRLVKPFCSEKIIHEDSALPVSSFTDDHVIKKLEITGSHSNILKNKRNFQSHLEDAVHRWSIQDPSEFWAEAASQLTWAKMWKKVLDDNNTPFTKWFVGGEMNVSYNCLDRHLENGKEQHIAICYDSPLTNTVIKVTYGELHKKVARFARVLVEKEVKLGDRVLLYMPNIPEAVAVMLACARIGAIHTVVFGGFASRELANRINHSKPKVIVSVNFGVEPGKIINYKKLLDEAVSMATVKPKYCLIFNRKGEQFIKVPMTAGRDFDLQELEASAAPHDCVPVDASHPLYILYTSGTTANPKAVVRPSGGYAVSLLWSMYHIYGINKYEAWFAASDLGWVVGHSYIVYAPLLNCNTTVLYEGKPINTPDPSAFYRLLNDYKVSGMFAAPTAMRALKQADPETKFKKDYTFQDLRYIFLAGEHCDHVTMTWVEDNFNVPALDHWWQTESGVPMTSTCVGLGADLFPPAGVSGKPVPGWNIKVLRDDSTECNDGELGNIAVKLPLPPASISTLWETEERFKKTYFETFPGYYATMDSGFRSSEGYIAVVSRTDDVINVSGHRLSSGSIEEMIMTHDQIADVVVVGLPDALKGHVPLAICVPKTGVQANRDLVKSVVDLVRRTAGPIASPKDVIFLNILPKTRSLKTPRKVLASMAAGEPYQIPTTILDETIFPEIEKIFFDCGYGSKFRK